MTPARRAKIATALKRILDGRTMWGRMLRELICSEEEAHQDKERLNWLIRQQWFREDVYEQIDRPMLLDEGLSTRQIIDAAIEAEEGS